MLRNVKFMISSRSCFMIQQIMCHVRKLISKKEYPDLRKIRGVGLRVNFGSIGSLRHHQLNREVFEKEIRLLVEFFLF